MAQKQSADLIDGVELNAGWQVIFRAVDPTTGADVASVTVSNAVLLVDNLASVPVEDLTVGPFMLVPGPAS